MGRIEVSPDRVTVVILGGGRGKRLDPLTRRRSKPAVPIAGKYRLIDVPISNAINSHMERMYVLTQFNSVSLHRHIGRTYRFDAFSKGYVQILAAQQTPDAQHWFQGTADAVRQYLPTLNDLEGDHVLVLAGDHMYRMDYRQLLRDHVDHDADITIGGLPCSEEEIGGFGAMRVNRQGEIVEFREKPADAEARRGLEVDPEILAQHGLETGRPYLASMGIYIFRKQVLVEALDNDLVDFGHDIIPAAVGRHRVQAHFFKGYWRDIGTIGAFFQAHIDLVGPNPPFAFNDREWPIYTRPRYLPGSRLTGCRFERTLLAEGTNITNSAVEESVVGLRTTMTGATVSRALIMGVDSHYPPSAPGDPPVGIGKGTVIINAIIDKNARIGRNVQITNEAGLQEADGDCWAIRDGIVVIPKNCAIPDNTVI